MRSESLVLLPAIDVAGGAVVSLVQGAAGTETDYGDPIKAALQWQREGAEWVHLVDLDAVFGRGDNRALLATLVRQLDIEVELSGGIRDDGSLAAALATGAARVNLGTAALESPDWVRSAIATYGERVAVGLDVRGTTLAGRGGPGRVVTCGEPLPASTPTAVPATSSPTSSGTACSPAPTCSCCTTCARAPMRPSSPAGESRRWTTCGRLPAWARTTGDAWRARLSARPCTPGRSRCPRRWWPSERSGSAAPEKAHAWLERHARNHAELVRFDEF